MKSHEKIWILLSDLFVDTERSVDELIMLGKALKATGCPVEEIEKILKYEVAPVCGTWMRYPTIGPWPMFDEKDLVLRIHKHIGRPWYRPSLIKNGLWGLSHVKKEWETVKATINNNEYLIQGTSD